MAAPSPHDPIGTQASRQKPLTAVRFAKISEKQYKADKALGAIKNIPRKVPGLSETATASSASVVPLYRCPLSAAIRKS